MVTAASRLGGSDRGRAGVTRPLSSGAACTVRETASGRSGARRRRILRDGHIVHWQECKNLRMRVLRYKPDNTGSREHIRRATRRIADVPGA